MKIQRIPRHDSSCEDRPTRGSRGPARRQVRIKKRGRSFSVKMIAGCSQPAAWPPAVGQLWKCITHKRLPGNPVITGGIV
jgi:hypothetical protein